MRNLTALLLLCLMTACSDQQHAAPAPREPDKHAVGFICRMQLSEHRGPKAQMYLKGVVDPFWFSSIRDAMSYVEHELVGEHELAGFWVTDVGQGSYEAPAPGSWVDAREATYVIGSSKVSGMGESEIVPFKSRADADMFVAEYGGTIVGYAEARKAASVENLEQSQLVEN